MTARRASPVLLALALAAAGVPGCKQPPSCYLPEIECGGSCVDGSRDPSNCGGCGVTCGSGQSCCGTCVDVATSPQNCGACGVRCPVDGVCGGSPPACSCPVGQPTKCGTNPGACVNLDTGLGGSCGACGHVCAGPNVSAGDATCSGATCSCTGGATDCGANPECVNLLLDPANCGTCGAACSVQKPHSTCAGGGCTCAGTATPTDCGAAGCVDVAIDPAHCGTCGTACTPSTQTCSSGKCCATGETNCSGACFDLQTSAAHCGTCGNACTGSKVCSAGTCACPGATPKACGSLCCEGTLCCSGGTACQTKHSNGLGGSFFDCTASYTSTDRALALVAADSWRAGTTFDTNCAGPCLVRQSTTTCGVWCYGTTGVSYAGRATETSCAALCNNFIAGSGSPWP